MTVENQGENAALILDNGDACRPQQRPNPHRTGSHNRGSRGSRSAYPTICMAFTDMIAGR